MHEIQISQPREGDHNRVAHAAQGLGWREVTESGSAFEFRVGTNWKSWGEHITITLQPGKLEVRSRCRFLLQCFDWGKNRDNCLRFARAYAGE